MSSLSSPISISRRSSGKSSHRRGSSQSSSASSPSIGSMSEMLQAMSHSPSGSKMAEDARKAMALAHRNRAAPAPVQIPAPVREVPSGPSTPVPFSSPAPSRVASPTPSDRMWSRLEAQEVQSPTIELDAFEFERFITEPPGPPEWAAAPPFPPAHPAPYPYAPERMLGAPGQIHGYQFAPGREAYDVYEPIAPATNLLRNPSQSMRPRVDHFAGVSPEQNALAIFWRGNHPQTFALITDPVGEERADETYPIEVDARHTQVLEMPDRWSGRVQRVTGFIDEPATRCAIEFGGYRGLTFFGVSYAWGNNGPAVMRGSQTQLQSGSPWRAAQVAPDAICCSDHGGTRVVHGTAYGPRHRRQTVRKLYRDFLEHPEQGGVELCDEAAIQATRDRHLLLDFY